MSEERREIRVNDQFLSFDLLTIPIVEFKGWSELLCTETLNRNALMLRVEAGGK